MRGPLITFEGVEGAGKSTQLELLADWLTSRGIEPVATREPGGTLLGEEIRGLLLDHRTPAMSADSELLLMFAARAEHIRTVIEPALNAGRWVLCDRFTDASYAYQGAGRGVGFDRVAVLEDWVQGSLRPDRVLVFDIAVAEGLDRAGNRAVPDRFETENHAFFERIRDAYLQRALDAPERYRVIDARGSITDVQQRVRASVREYGSGVLD